MTKKIETSAVSVCLCLRRLLIMLILFANEHGREAVRAEWKGNGKNKNKQQQQHHHHHHKSCHMQLAWYIMHIFLCNAAHREVNSTINWQLMKFFTAVWIASNADGQCNAKLTLPCIWKYYNMYWLGYFPSVALELSHNLLVGFHRATACNATHGIAKESYIWAFDWYQNRWPWMTSNGAMALILRYFVEFGSFRDSLRKSDWLAINRFSHEKCHKVHRLSTTVRCALRGSRASFYDKYTVRVTRSYM